MKKPQKTEPYGYLIDSGYNGWVNWLGRYVIFATEEEYLEYIKEEEEN